MKSFIQIALAALALLAFAPTARAASPYVINQTSGTFNVPVTFNKGVTFSSSTSSSTDVGSSVVNSTAGCVLYVGPTGLLACDSDNTGFFYTSGQVFIPFLTITNTAQLNATMHVNSPGSMDFTASPVRGFSTSTFGWDGVVTATNTGNAFGGDGSKLTAITAANISAGSLGASVKTSSVAVNAVGVGQMNFTGTPSATTYPNGSGAWSTIADGSLSSNIPLKNGANTFTAIQTLPAGAGSGTIQPSGILDTLIVSSGMAAGSAAETTLYTYTIPANTLVSTATYKPQAIHIMAGGSFATAATLEEVKVYFGATVVFDSTAGNFGTNKWVVNCDVIQRTTGASQQAGCAFTNGTANIVNSSTASTESITAGIVVKITGTVQVATANGVSLETAYVEKK